MSNVLTINERIKLFLLQPDGIYLKKYNQFDFSTIDQFYEDLIKTTLAFGNTEGGHILISKIEMLCTTTSNALYDIIKSSCVIASNFFNVEEVEYDSKKFFYIQINKSTSPVKHKNGRYFKRNKAVNLEWKLNSEQSINKENEIKSIEYEREIVTNASYEDLNEELITEIISNSKSILIKEPKKFLQQYNLIESKGNDDFIITKAALLLFSKKPKKWHPNIDIRFTQFKTSELPTGENFSRVKDETEEGNIITLIKSSWDHLRPILTEDTFVSKDKLFKRQILYPEDACAEALLNAIAHRDYSIQGRCIEIRIFEDKLEVISPGGLLSTINIEDLRNCKGVHESRNPFIARTLRDIGYMRELGEGIKRIYETLRQNDLQNPELENIDGSFKVTLFHKYVYTTDEKKYLLNFSDIELSKAEKDVIRLGVLKKPLSRSDIMNAANLKSADEFQQLMIQLQAKDLIKILYGQPASRNMAIKQKIKVKDLPRFLILLPGQEAKYESANNEAILKRNPSCVIFKFVPTDFVEEKISVKLEKMGIQHEVISKKEYSGSYSLVFNLFESENVRKVIDKVKDIVEEDKNIKVYPFFLSGNKKVEIGSDEPDPLNKPNISPIKDRKPNIKSINTKTYIGGKLPKDYTIPEDFINGNVKVKNLPNNVDEQVIINFFQQWGKVIDLTIDKNTKNQAYIRFKDPKAAYFLISKSGEWRFNGNTLIIVAKTERLTPDH